MADKGLNKMKRSELIDIIYALQEEEEELRRENEELRQQLEERRIIMKKSGSIAEACLGINKVMDAAQRAADQYVASVMKSADDYLEDIKKKGNRP